MSALRLPKIYAVVFLVFGLVFVFSGLVINFFQLCSLALWPLNKNLYRKVNCRLTHSFWSQLVVLLEWWSGSEFNLFTDQDSVDKIGKKQAIVIFNHTFEIDLLCFLTLCERYGMLGSSRVLVKKELLYVPVIGWITYFNGNIFCKRKWEEDKHDLVEGLSGLAHYPEPWGFLLCCEGTRFTKEKHRISMQVAESKGLPKLKYHLLPRSKGFTTVVQCLREKASAIYDVTLNFGGRQNPTLLGLIRREKYKADMYFRRIPLEEIPLDDNEIAKWLHELYQEKDVLQEFYNQTGIFPGKQIICSRRPWDLLNVSFWATITLFALFKLALGVFLSGSLLLTLTFFGFSGGAFFGIQRLVGVTEIEKGSSYGNQKFQKKE
ncbi:1-acyl-sn-glycerol-3-phosphate acyltransferase gamma-like [Trichosurus vulpecula]|uniref:1-acyl-sn-glycerol-3-phosphate acyltransferase gamma-like n=1 Tax=Trichosurus vulpecula TaxID=9337 RepID=UPI00186B45FF|nr:1-acyl-sn-glycerol-3-phosphate acyltransferase gamma-like [Trichosurus vulpecula]